MSDSDATESDNAELDRADVAPSGNSARIGAGVVGVVVVALIALLAFGGGDSIESDSRLLNQRVPDVAGVSLAGDRFDIDDHRGQWVLVNFFATWCTACVVEHPDLLALSDWGAANGSLEVVSVVFNDEPDAVANYFEAYNGNWPVISDPGLAIDFQVSQVPETFVVNPDGIVVAHLIGGVDADSVIEAIS